jgi:hypothetical protein
MSKVPSLGKVGEAAVISAFGLFREAAAGKLFALEVILQTLTADALSRTAGITATAKIHVFIFFTFHKDLRLEANSKY